MQQRRSRFRGDGLDFRCCPELRYCRYLTFSFICNDSLHLLAQEPARLTGSFHAYIGDYVTPNGQPFTDHGTYVPRVRIPVRLSIKSQ